MNPDLKLSRFSKVFLFFLFGSHVEDCFLEEYPGLVNTGSSFSCMIKGEESRRDREFNCIIMHLSDLGIMEFLNGSLFYVIQTVLEWRGREFKVRRCFRHVDEFVTRHTLYGVIMGHNVEMERTQDDALVSATCDLQSERGLHQSLYIAFLLCEAS